MVPVGSGRVGSTGQYIGVAAFFFFSFGTGLKLDEKSIENGLEGQKLFVVRLYWGGCHHPNVTTVFNISKIQPSTILISNPQQL